jgi:hypothetical protein
MRVGQLFGNAALGPDALKVITQAFDSAWDDLKATISARPEAIEAARLDLAGLVLSLASADTRDPLTLKDEAVRRWKAKRPTAD